MADIKLVIGNKNYSSWSLRAWWLLKKAGIDFEEIRIPPSTAQTKKQILQYSPAGRVPVYIENDRIIWDSLAIAETLAEKKPGLWPDDERSRAYARSISAEIGFSPLT
jgi:glutathione S-transferase